MTAVEPRELTMPLLSEYEDAAESLRGVVNHTPLEYSQHLTEVLGVPVHLKLENLQRTGSFKIRGAAYRLSRLTPEERARGVVAASAGNHAQGVALAAQALGIPATIFMPLGVPVPKLLATRGYGADVVLEGPTVDTSLRLAAEFAERTGAVLIPPFNHRDIIVGQGTLGLEAAEDMPAVDTVILAIGGWGPLARAAAGSPQTAGPPGWAAPTLAVSARHAPPSFLKTDSARRQPTGPASPPTSRPRHGSAPTTGPDRAGAATRHIPRTDSRSPPTCTPCSPQRASPDPTCSSGTPPAAPTR